MDGVWCERCQGHLLTADLKLGILKFEARYPQDHQVCPLFKVWPRLTAWVLLSTQLGKVHPTHWTQHQYQMWSSTCSYVFLLQNHINLAHQQPFQGILLLPYQVGTSTTLPRDSHLLKFTGSHLNISKTVRGCLSVSKLVSNTTDIIAKNPLMQFSHWNFKNCALLHFYRKNLNFFCNDLV